MAKTTVHKAQWQKDREAKLNPQIYRVESEGKRFVRFRILPGRVWKRLRPGDPLKLGKHKGVVKSIGRRILVLEKAP